MGQHTRTHLAGGMIAAMMFVFLSSALSDSVQKPTQCSSSKPMQKILLNHAQLVSLASGFLCGLMQSRDVHSHGDTRAGWMYMFNPACNGVELVEGESMFFQNNSVF